MVTKSQQLARVAGKPNPVAKVIDAASAPPPPPFTSTAASLDDHDVHVGIVRHLGLDFSLGAALEQIGEARRLKGADRRAKVERAIRYLSEELQHC